MSSTRNINTPGNYNLERMQDNTLFQEIMYSHNSYGKAVHAALPSGGNAPPSRLSNYNLSHNPVAVESQLFGIGSTNLVNPQSIIQNQPKQLNNITFFYRNNIIMPNKLVVEKNQRGLIQ